MAKHKKIEVMLPDWAVKTTNDCLRSVAEDAYVARAMAASYGAAGKSSCGQLLSAAEKSMKTLENPKASMAARCSAGDRAARKYWEAKICARSGKAAR